jgi:biotin carboxyl carrier protein
MATHQVLAPLPGIFYRRPSPEEQPFKSEGDAVASGDTVGLVEAMKSFFPAEAEQAGKLVRFCVEDGEAVDAEQVLAEIET